jgi:N-acetylmuramoyl-L-alanine amidase
MAPLLVRQGLHSAFASRCLTLALVLVGAIAVARTASQADTYTVYATDGQDRALTFRTSGNVDMVDLDQVARLFGLSLAEDALAGGLTVSGRGQTILLIPGQTFASIGPGRIVSLPAAVERDGDTWFVPVDFLRVAVGPALNTRIEVRRPSRRIIVGDVNLPQVTAHFERQGPAGRLVLDVRPATPHQVSREGNQIVVRFDAVAIDLTPPADLAADLVSSIRADGTALIVALGPSVAGYDVDEPGPTQLHIALLPPGPAPGTEPPAVSTVPDPDRPPALDLGTPGVRTVVIDPGHGGDDTGVVGPGGTTEKDFVLRFAGRLKAAIESRFGLRVLLTRDGDTNVPVDRRAAVANNNKADLFISLHANGSLQPGARGAQVLSLGLDDYGNRSATGPGAVGVPTVGGGLRQIEVLPWETAQTGFTRQSATVADILRLRLRDNGIELIDAPSSVLPLRPLVGASMPAVMIELGTLSNADDERALAGGDRLARIVNAILETIAMIRQGIPTASAGVEP